MQLPLEIWQRVFEFEDADAQTQTSHACRRFHRHFRGQVALSILETVWYPRLHHTTKHWDVPTIRRWTNWPSRQVCRAPGMLGCFVAVAQSGRSVTDKFWNGIVRHLPPHFVGDCVCLADHYCNCWAQPAYRHRWMNAKKSRRLRREIWQELGRIAGRTSLSTDAFREGYLLHSAAELPNRVASVKHVRQVRRLLGVAQETQ